MKKTLLALTLTASSAFAQQAPPHFTTAQVDARFGAWVGCWRLEDDLAGTGARMCITPDKNGVRLQTIVGTNRGIDELVIPDGVAHPINDQECQGTEQADWSKDGTRVFRSTNVTCGKETPRIIKSVAFLAPGPSWVSVQEISGASATTNVRVQRYRRSSNQQLADGSMAPQPPFGLADRATVESTAWDVDDVIEASGKIPTEALQAALSEIHHGFALNKKALLALDDAGVRDQVIDLMVALTYPKRFVVERAAGTGSSVGLSTGAGWFDPFLTGMATTPYADCYAPYGYGYRSYYSMCGNSYGYAMYGYPYSSYGYGYGYGYPGGGWVVVDPVPPIGSIPPVISAGEGRLVNGHGYTQIHNRDAEPAPRTSNGGNGGNGSAAGYSGGNVSSGGYSSGSSNSGSSSGGGSSSGDSGARVAVPKGPGGH
ncbi:MAG: hypothetical protein ABI983_09495 [Acidobacteriota bacterium]